MELKALCKRLPNNAGDRLQVIIGQIVTASPDVRAKALAMLSKAAAAEDESLFVRLRTIDEIIAYLLDQGPTKQPPEPAFGRDNVTPLRRRSVFPR